MVMLLLLPVGFGFPPDCQPLLMTPTPGSETIVEPSSLAEPVPTATNCQRSWSNEYISVTSPGARPSRLGMVIAAGGSKCTPGGWTVTMKRGCCPKPGVIGILSLWTSVAEIVPARLPLGK